MPAPEAREIATHLLLQLRTRRPGHRPPFLLALPMWENLLQRLDVVAAEHVRALLSFEGPDAKRHEGGPSNGDRALERLALDDFHAAAAEGRVVSDVAGARHDLQTRKVLADGVHQPQARFDVVDRHDEEPC